MLPYEEVVTTWRGNARPAPTGQKRYSRALRELFPDKSLIVLPPHHAP